jgi:hypothetical protein
VCFERDPKSVSPATYCSGVSPGTDAATKAAAAEVPGLRMKVRRVGFDGPNGGVTDMAPSRLKLISKQPRRNPLDTSTLTDIGIVGGPLGVRAETVLASSALPSSETPTAAEVSSPAVRRSN